MDKRLLENHLNLLDKMRVKFDENPGLVYEDFDNPNAYHTKLRKGRYHRFTTNSDFAIALLDGGRQEDIPMAKSIIKALLAAQCREEGDTFGLWPYFYEESLEEMDMPDWNMADFNGISLLQTIIDYGGLLGEELSDEVRQACINACASIMRRDVTIVYTNVTVMDIYMTLVCGEMFDKDIFEFGMNKLKRFYHFVMSQKSYEEYNSPTYSIVVVNIMGLMLQHVKNGEALKTINELNELAWKMIGEHYHAKTCEWSGPMSRAYSDFLDDTRLSFFEKALDFKIKLTDKKIFGIMDMRYDVKCPQKFAHYFTDETQEINITRMLSPGYNYPYFGHPRVEMLYMNKDFTLGSFHLSDGWNQHRNVMSYFGDADKKYCLRLVALHNGYDYCSAFFNTVQEKGAALTITNFHTNRGDTHHDLDKVVNATIKAEDMRIRYQIEANTKGIIDDIKICKKESSCSLEIAGVPVEITYIFAEFGEEKPYFEVSGDEKHLYVDMVLYHGEEKEFNFNKIPSAAAVSAINVGGFECGVPSAEKGDKYVTAKWRACGKELSAESIYKPIEMIPSVSVCRQYKDGEQLEKIAESFKA